MQPRLNRSRTDRMLGGVCGGLGHYFGVDPVIVRLIFVVLAFTTFITPIIYPILWLVMPEDTTPMPTAAQQQVPLDARFDPMTGQPLPPRAPMYAEPGTQPHAVPRSRNRTLGFVLAGLGAIILLDNIGDIAERLFSIQLGGFMVPIVLVGVGLFLLRKKTV